jgi:hypothetical protein
MNNPDVYKDTKTRIRNRVHLIRDLVNRASAMPHMTQEDLCIAKEALNSVEYGERIFFQSIEALHQTNPALAGDIAWAVDHLTAGTLMAASRATLSDSARNAAAYKQAQEARLARQNSPQEVALIDAIEKALNGRDPSTRGMAGKILDRVNQALAAAGHKTVLRDTVGRRLKKLRS